MSTITTTLESGGTRYQIIDLRGVAGERLERLPWITRIFVENVLRAGGDARALLEPGQGESEIAFWPSRLLMHDTTSGPALVDIAAARWALAEAGGDPASLNPVLPVDVSTDHSIAAEVYGASDAVARNTARELTRNAERYRFAKWATEALEHFRVHPPGTGIMHTINLERLASVVTDRVQDGVLWAIPDTLIGTDSHTPMVNGIGVLGWGVGGLEAESVMFGAPVVLQAPKVVGVRLLGRLRPGVTATDAALLITQRLRRTQINGRFLEYFGPGVSTLSAGERSVIANMAPEYGSASGYFAVDDATLAYLRQTGRSEAQVSLVHAYAQTVGLWFDPAGEPAYDEVVEIDLSAAEVSLAGPKRPQDRLAPAETAERLGDTQPTRQGVPRRPVAIAAITSCTNTTDPRQLIEAGLLARRARRFGLSPPPWVKTVLAPGSPTAKQILQRAGLLTDLEALGFAIVGYGCTVCIGNSGPLADAIAPALSDPDVRPVAVLSGNRNFPGRVHPQVQDAFLASPALVLAFALSGNASADITSTALGTSPIGRPIWLADLWPPSDEVDAVLAEAVRPADYDEAYRAAEASTAWAALEAPSGPLYPWDEGSTYIRRPPFARVSGEARLGRYYATPLMVLGDDITTDHISPAGAISSDSEAARWLVEHGADPRDLNVFSSRRGAWEVMLRGLFTNPAVVNLLAEGLAPGETLYIPSDERMPLWQAAARYAEADVPLVIVAGERYGMGSSRDWAAKGVSLLGVRAVLANGFERIHRSNLVNMGVLPLRLPPERHSTTLQLKPGDCVEIDARADSLSPGAEVPVVIHRADGSCERLDTLAEVQTGLEVATLRAGGVLPLLLQQRLAASG